MATQNREPAVSGLFYESNPQKLNAQIAALFNSVQTTIAPNQNICALIVPHAGYIYSGTVAASGYALLPKTKRWDHIFIIGSSHRAHFKGAAICKLDGFETPLGLVRTDKETMTALTKKSPLFQNNIEAHAQEHTIEVQLPFLQYWLEHPFKITPILMGTHSAETCEAIADVLRLYFTPNNLFIISSDFSHYPPYPDATMADKATANAIVSNQPQKLLNQLASNDSMKYHNLQTSLCGWTSVLTLLHITEKKDDVSYDKIIYQNSGDAPMGDQSRVVGYWAIAVEQKQDKAEFTITEDEKKALLKWSRHCLNQSLGRTTSFDSDLSKTTGTTQAQVGAFVTLHKRGQLRGCIGNFSTNRPLWQTIDEMTLAAAFNDYRFDEVTANELADIDIEISVLSPLRPIQSHHEIAIGKHGVYLKKGHKTATFLPQVAIQHHWNAEELLGHLSADKAGMGWDDWKTAELWVYEATVFGELEFGLPF